MTITCPHCQFSREIDDARIPAGTVRVACPRCKEKFAFGREAQPATAATATATATATAPVTAPVAAFAAAPDSAALALPKAGFWIRVVASLIDALLLIVAMAVLGSLLFLTTGFASSELSSEGHLALGLLTQLFLAALQTAYYVLFTGYGGQTPGKMAVRIKVVRTDGNAIGYGTAALREIVGKFVSSLIFGIGYLLVAFDAQKQGLHDKIASTYVIKL